MPTLDNEERAEAQASTLARTREWVRQAAARPEFGTDVLQIAKCVVAATAAWWASVHLLNSPVPFLAPWTALLTVHATVYQSLSRGLQTAVASTVGVALSFLLGHFLGASLWTFALAMFVGVAASRLSWLRDEGVAIATTSIFILGSGFKGQAPLLDDRLMDIALGVVVGFIVNALVIPPIRDQQAARYIDDMNRQMGEILVSMASELSTSWKTDQIDEWVDETLTMEHDLDSAWKTVHVARESARMNPRTYVDPFRKRLGGRRHGSAAAQVSYEEILGRVGEGVSHLRHLARTLLAATQADSQWDDAFREQWVAVVRDAGEAIKDPDADVEPIHDRLEGLAVDFADDRAHFTAEWPLYGSLVTSMRHIALVVDDVASARAAREGSADNPTSHGV